MPVYKNEKNGTWYAMIRYKDWTGTNKQKCQRGFSTRKEEAYGFFFEFIRTNVQINAELTEAEQVIFNLIQNNEGISKAEMAIRIGKSEKTVQRLISSFTKKQVIEREGSNKSGSWKIKVS